MKRGIIMKLLFKQRFFSWFDSYDIYYEDGSVAYTVQGQLSWGHRLVVSDAAGNRVGELKERVFRFLPQFEVFIGGSCVGCIKKEFTFFKPQFTVDFNGWRVDGELFEWDYRVTDFNGSEVASISKELFRFTDTYVIDVYEPANALSVLILVLAIDAEKCSRGG